MVSTATDRARDGLVPNLLSFARIPLAGLLWVAPHAPAWTLSVLFAAGLTDVLDGWLVRRARARRLHDRDPGALSAHLSQGAFIDGMADKIFVVSAVALLAWTMEAPPAILAVLCVREILFVPLMVIYRASPEHLRKRVDFTAGVPGKAATVAQFTALVLGLLHHPWFVPAAFVAGAIGVGATAIYVVRAARAARVAA
jgi:phosphatidylglycerophosphate synthase